MSLNKFAIFTLTVTVSGCGFARATEQDLQAAIDQANAAATKSRQEAAAAWNMTACQICTYSNCFSGFGCAGATDKTCSQYATSYCQEVGCGKYESLASCQAYIQICKDSKTSDYENYDPSK